MLGGIDEAGRGPVIGPMVMAIAVIDPKDEFKLQAMGVKDSKLLSLRKRNELFDVLKDLCKVEVEIVFPEEIDRAVLSDTDNLNWLEARTAAKLVNKVKADKIILDCPSNNMESFKEYTMKHVTTNADIVLEHKADLNNLIVGAASIIAKVTRDKMVEEIKRQVGVDFGVGYPSDPKTRAFIKKYWNDPQKNVFMRKSWSTWQKVAKENSQKNLGDY